MHKFNDPILAEMARVADSLGATMGGGSGAGAGRGGSISADVKAGARIAGISVRQLRSHLRTTSNPGLHVAQMRDLGRGNTASVPRWTRSSRVANGRVLSAPGSARR